MGLAGSDFKITAINVCVKVLQRARRKDTERQRKRQTETEIERCKERDTKREREID